MALTIGSMQPPVAAGLDAPADQYSAARALKHAAEMAAAPHPVGSPAHENVRKYVVGALANLGLEASSVSGPSVVRIAGSTRGAEVTNVVATLHGSSGRSGPAVLLAAHYDSVPQSLGASDDGSGIATLLETARALQAGPPLRNDVVFLFTDAEEMGACGALLFTGETEGSRTIGVALNFEARGTGGPVALYDTSSGNAELIGALSAVAHPVSTSLLSSLAQAIPNDSDATVFKRAGMPTLAFAYVDHVERYHQRTDAPEALDPRSLQHDGDYALPLARTFGNATLPLGSAGDRIYFDVFGRLVVAYPPWVARALGAATLLLFAALLSWALRSGAIRGRDAVAGFGRSLVALLAAVVAAALAHTGVAAAGDGFVLRVHPGQETLACVVAAVGALGIVLSGTPRPRLGVTFGAHGVWAASLRSGDGGRRQGPKWAPRRSSRCGCRPRSGPAWRNAPRPRASRFMP